MSEEVTKKETAVAEKTSTNKKVGAEKEVKSLKKEDSVASEKSQVKPKIKRRIDQINYFFFVKITSSIIHTGFPSFKRKLICVNFMVIVSSQSNICRLRSSCFISLN